LFEKKVNLVGASEGQKFKFTSIFQKRHEKWEFYAKSILIFGVTLKQMTT